MNKTLADVSPIAVPESVAKCPICGATIVIDAIDEWEIESGEVCDTGFSLDCAQEPPFDICSDYSDAKNLKAFETWSEWYQAHWSQPYTDWLPLMSVVRDWFNQHYRIVDDKRGETSELYKLVQVEVDDPDLDLLAEYMGGGKYQHEHWMQVLEEQAAEIEQTLQELRAMVKGKQDDE